VSEASSRTLQKGLPEGEKRTIPTIRRGTKTKKAAEAAFSIPVRRITSS
jgi:hypothetical protein